ncbi:hypothetical protein [Paraburkholderia strydomiana]|uniref:hypothetical protein n=1 Tax=Paraburkholderia strydomiana TaxID=1245417 RepID=UPI0038BA00DE
MKAAIIGALASAILSTSALATPLTFADSAACTQHGALVGRMGMLLVTHKSSIAKLRNEAQAQRSTDDIKSMNRAIDALLLEMADGDGDPLVWAANSAALCMQTRQ